MKVLSLAKTQDPQVIHPVTSAVDPGLHQSPDPNLHQIVVNRMSCFQLSSKGWRDTSSLVNTRAVRDVECLPSTCFSKHAQEFTVTPAKVSKYGWMFQQVWHSFYVTVMENLCQIWSSIFVQLRRPFRANRIICVCVSVCRIFPKFPRMSICGMY